MAAPLYIRIHPNDNVAIVANDGGLPAGTRFACGLVLREHVPQGHKEELLPRYPNVDGVVALAHTYGCGVAIDAPGAEVPIRTLRNISRNPNFGGEVMLVSLGCEKLQPERLMPRDVTSGAADAAPLDLVCLQDEAHVGFMSMIESIVRSAEVHLERLNARRQCSDLLRFSACLHT